MKPTNKQIEATEALYKRKKCLFTNPTGTGKSLILANLTKKTDKKWLIVAPLTSLPQWSKYDINADLIHFEAFRTKKITPYDYIIVDEAHKIKNYTAVFSRVLIQHLKKAERVILTTATPSETHPINWYWMLKLTHPKFKDMTRDGFIVRYCEYSFVKIGYRTLIIPKNDINEAKLNKLIPDIDKVTVKNIEQPTDHLTFHTIKIPVDIKFDKRIEHFSKARKLAGMKKVEYLMDIKFDFSNALIFCHHTEVANLLYINLVSHLLTGKTKQRQQLINCWKVSHLPLILTYGVGGVALDLNAPHIDKVILLESSHSPQVDMQAYSRASRWNFDKKIDIYFCEAVEPISKVRLFRKEYFGVLGKDSIGGK